MKSGRTCATALLLALSLAACSSSPTLKLGATQAVSLTSLATGALVGGAIYLVYDPLAPNWELEETHLGEDTYRLSMKMKRYHTGGAGESLQILKRRAGQLQATQGYENYVLLDYTEGIDSQTLGARRVAEGTVKLISPRQANSFMQN